MAKKRTQTHVHTDYGVLTIKQEVYCWRYALHGLGMRAYREAFVSRTQNAQNNGSLKLLRKDKIIKRIEHLVRMHKEGKIDVKAGPWKHYGLKEPPEAQRKWGTSKLTWTQMALTAVNNVKA